MVVQGVLQALPPQLPAVLDVAIKYLSVGGAAESTDSGSTSVPFHEIVGMQGDLDAKSLVAIHQDIVRGLIDVLESERKMLEDAVVPVTNDWAVAKKIMLTLEDTIEAAKLRLSTYRCTALFLNMALQCSTGIGAEIQRAE